jgi:hypothetical protein
MRFELRLEVAADRPAVFQDGIGASHESIRIQVFGNWQYSTPRSAVDVGPEKPRPKASGR